jgi:hypothetical protein
LEENDEMETQEVADTNKANAEQLRVRTFLHGEMQLFESMMKDVDMTNRGEETMIKNLMTVACYTKDRVMQYRAVKYLLLADPERGTLGSLNGKQVVRVIKGLEKFATKNKIPFAMGTVLFALQYERGEHMTPRQIAMSVRNAFRN